VFVRWGTKVDVHLDQRFTLRNMKVGKVSAYFLDRRGGRAVYRDRQAVKIETLDNECPFRFR
jgi:hypothetical protein